MTPARRAVILDRVPGPPLPEAAVSPRSRRWSVSLLLALTALIGLTPPVHPEPAPAPDADPLPKGAKVRYGLARHATRAWALPVPPGYATVLVADPDGGVGEYDLVTGRRAGRAKQDAPPAEPQPPAAGGNVVAVSADGQRAVVSRPTGLTVRDVATGEEVAELPTPGQALPGPTAGASGASLSADGAVLAAAGRGQNGRAEVVVWDVAKREVVGRVPAGLAGGVIPLLSPDGTLVATRGQSFTEPNPAAGGRPAPADAGPAVTVWEVATGKELFRARLSVAGPLSGVAFSPDGKTLATGSGDGPVDLWEVPTGKPARTLLGRTGQGARIAFSPDGKQLAAVAADGTVQRWALPDGTPAGSTDPPAELPPVQPGGVAFAPGGRVVAWGRAGTATLVWEAPSGKLLTPVGAHTGAVRSIGFGAGGKELVTAGSDGRVVRWDLATGKPLGPVALRVPRPAGGFVAPGPRGPIVLAADAARALTTGFPSAVFDLSTGAERFAVPRGPAQRSTSHQFPSPDLSKVAVLSTSFDPRQPGKCVVWDLVNQRKMVEFDVTAAGGPAPAAGFSPDGNRLVTVTVGRDPAMGRQATLVAGWDLTTGRKLGEVEDPAAFGVAVVAVGSETAAVVVSGGRLWAVDYEGGRKGDDLEAGPARGVLAGEAVAFAADGTMLAAGVNDPSAGGFGVRLYDWPRGTVRHTLVGHAAPVTGLAFTPDGKGLVSGSADTTAVLWDLTSLPQK